MTQKVNPGCELPPTKLPPSLEKFAEELSKKVAAKYAKIYAAPDPKLEAEANKIAQQKAVLEQIDREAKANDTMIKEYQKRMENLAKISCPLPYVEDKAATTK